MLLRLLLWVVLISTPLWFAIKFNQVWLQQLQHLSAQANQQVVHLQSQWEKQLQRRSHISAQAENTFFATPAARPYLVDGYLDDWQRSQHYQTHLRYGDNKAGFLRAPLVDVARFNVVARYTPQWTYLSLEVFDDHWLHERYGHRDRQLGDHLILLLSDVNQRAYRYQLSGGAPGVLTVSDYIDGEMSSYRGRRIQRLIRAAWQPTRHGYSVEIRMPRQIDTSHFGITVVDQDSVSDTGSLYWSGSVDPKSPHLPSYYLQSHTIVVPETDWQHVSIYDHNGWLFAAQSLRSETPKNAFIDWIATQMVADITSVFTLDDKICLQKVIMDITNIEYCSLSLGRMVTYQRAIFWRQPIVVAGETVASVTLSLDQNQLFLDVTKQTFRLYGHYLLITATLFLAVFLVKFVRKA